MSMLDWAKREVEIACKKENPDRKEGEFDYGCACYESALKAYESLCEDKHSGFSIKMTQSILNQLIDGKPLTPIEDVEDVWNLCPLPCNADYCLHYQCKRMSSLFKHIYLDGTVEYYDHNYCYCQDYYDHSNTYFSGLVSNIIHEMYPIQMPYTPGKPIEVVCEEFLVDPKNGDFDTIGVFYCVKEDKDKVITTDINRFFAEIDGKTTEISKDEYNKRKQMSLERKNKK